MLDKREVICCNRRAQQNIAIEIRANLLDCSSFRKHDAILEITDRPGTSQIRGGHDCHYLICYINFSVKAR